MTHFGCDGGMGSSCSHDQTEIARRRGFEIKLAHLGQAFIDRVRHPEFGYGKNMNPCIDCRILMLRWAGDYMRMAGAQCVVTGEVLDQRPMSQRLGNLRRVEKVSGLEGRVLRPLSAQLLPPTIPEQEGLVDRSKLCAIRGRTRREQLALARRFGITEIPQPAGGCLLTDPIYSARLRDLFDHVPQASAEDITLLQAGRHFRLAPDCRIVVGRNESDNGFLLAEARPGDVLLDVHEHVGPVTLLRGAVSDDRIAVAGGITAAYSRRPQPDPATIRYGIVTKDGGEPAWRFVTVPLPRRDAFEPMRIGGNPRASSSVRTGHRRS
jgi:tRNA U34 2-thiouridine synthase MnmA/TrmU